MAIRVFPVSFQYQGSAYTYDVKAEVEITNGDSFVCIWHNVDGANDELHAILCETAEEMVWGQMEVLSQEQRDADTAEAYYELQREDDRHGY